MSESLLRHPLVFVAHQDDEAIGCALLLQRAEESTVIFATDGAPDDPYFWHSHGSQAALAEARRQEAREAMSVIGVTDFHFFEIPDQKLHLHLEQAIERLTAIAQRSGCSALVTHAYEGGHPDHDSCSYIAFRVGQQLGMDIWEMPLYHRARGKVSMQHFLSGDADLVLTPTNDEYRRKQQMAEKYVSQGNLMTAFPARSEQFRRQPVYDYARPPHEGRLNYEAWQWPITGADVSRAISNTRAAGVKA